MKKIVFLLVTLIIFLAGCDRIPGIGTTDQSQASKDLDSAGGSNTDVTGQQPVGTEPPTGTGAPQSAQNTQSGQSTPTGTQTQSGETNDERAIMRSLYKAGIDANADISKTGTKITFALPEGIKEKNAAYYAFGIAASFTAPENKITVEITNSGKKTSYSVSSEKARQLINEDISETEFESSVKAG